MSARRLLLGGERAACGRRFDEALLSGWVDGMLTQEQRQMVELHLESCATCGAEVSALVAVRDAARGTRFALPADEQWDERPHGDGSRVARLSGWVLVGIWAVLVAGAGLVELVRSGAPAWERLLIVGGVAGFALLLLSALLDRLQQLGQDRYRSVQK